MNRTPSNLTPSIVVFASGRGSNFKAICQSVRDKKCNVKVQALIINIPNCGATQFAKEYNIPIYTIDSTTMKRSDHEKEIHKVLNNITFDWIVLAGYMRIFSSEFIQKYSNKFIINIHPSLLPSFKGINGYQQAFNFGSKITGHTIHLVDEECDHGAIISQNSFEIKDTDSINAIEERGIELENKMYPKVLNDLASKNWKIHDLPNQRKKVVFL